MENTKVNDKELYKKSAGKIINPFYFTDEVLKIGFEISLNSDKIDHSNSIVSFIPIHLDIGV